VELGGHEHGAQSAALPTPFEFVVISLFAICPL
jgi:hypothetical protein